MGSKRTGDDLADRLLNFAARIGNVVESLPDTRLGRQIAGQLIRSGTSPAPNYAEAGGAESRRDFIHKLGICLKELRESLCWIQMIIKAELLPDSRMRDVHDDTTNAFNCATSSANPLSRQSPPTRPRILHQPKVDSAFHFDF